MVIDACIFFNEVDLLEIRLNHLKDHVDRHVIVEACQTFQGETKPAYFWDLAHTRFQPFLSKIVHILIPAYPVIRHRLQEAHPPRYGDTWTAEYLSRNVLSEVLRFQSPDDFVIVSDVDEIPDLRRWDRKSEGLFECWQHYYYLDYRDVDYVQPAPCIVKRSTIDRLGSVQRLRAERGFLPRIPKAGWHYSCMGGAQAVAYKLRSFSHQEYNLPQFTAPDRIAERMRTGRDVLDRDHLHTYERVPIDDTFPPWVLDNLSRYRHLLSPEAKLSLTDSLVAMDLAAKDA